MDDVGNKGNKEAFCLRCERRNKNIKRVTFHENNGSMNNNEIISINCNASPIVIKIDSSIPTEIKKSYCKIHPHEVETDICDHCYNTKQKVCQECTKDQNMLVKMGILSNGLGTICAECVNQF